MYHCTMLPAAADELAIKQGVSLVNRASGSCGSSQFRNESQPEPRARLRVLAISIMPCFSELLMTVAATQIEAKLFVKGLGYRVSGLMGCVVCTLVKFLHHLSSA